MCSSIRTKIRRRRSTLNLSIIQRILTSQSTKNRFILYIVLSTRIGLIPIRLNLTCRRMLSGFLCSVSRRLSRSLCRCRRILCAFSRGLSRLCRSLSTLCRSSRTLSGSSMSLCRSSLSSSGLCRSLSLFDRRPKITHSFFNKTELITTLSLHSLYLSTTLRGYKTNLLGTFVRYR